MWWHAMSSISLQNRRQKETSNRRRSIMWIIPMAAKARTTTLQKTIQWIELWGNACAYLPVCLSSVACAIIPHYEHYDYDPVTIFALKWKLYSTPRNSPDDYCDLLLWLTRENGWKKHRLTSAGAWEPDSHGLISQHIFLLPSFFLGVRCRACAFGADVIRRALSSSVRGCANSSKYFADRLWAASKEKTKWLRNSGWDEMKKSHSKDKEI